MSTGHPLPPDITEGATLRGNEYGWSVSSFPSALAKAQAGGYACLGGQFQFRLDDGSTCEMYWLKADSTERTRGEAWADYSSLTCGIPLKSRLVRKPDKSSGPLSRWIPLRRLRR